MINENYYYSPYCIFVFETMEDCGNSSSSHVHPSNYMHTAIERIQEEIKKPVLCSNPNDVIFVIKKEIDCFWHVIIGEKFGWIYVRPNVASHHQYIFPLSEKPQ